MKILTFVKKNYIPLALFFFYATSHAQNDNTKIIQDSRFEQLLNEKRKINISINNTDSFRIQIYTGENLEAKKTLNEYKNNNKNTEATMVFHTPIYKVWIGQFDTRIEAENKLKSIRKKYPNAQVIKAKI